MARVSSRRKPEQWADDEQMTLLEAAAVFFPKVRSKLPLRTTIGNGDLDYMRCHHIAGGRNGDRRPRQLIESGSEQLDDLTYPDILAMTAIGDYGTAAIRGVEDGALAIEGTHPDQMARAGAWSAPH